MKTMSDRLIPSKSTVYISNLPYDLSNNDVHKLFEKHGRIVKVTVMRDRVTRRSRGVAFVYFLRQGDAARCVAETDGRETFGRTLKCSIARDNGRSAEFIRRKEYGSKARCYECGGSGHLSYGCSRNVLGEREPPPRRARKRRRRGADEARPDDAAEADDFETLSAAIALEREKSELEEYRYRVATGNYESDGVDETNRKRIKKSSYFSDEEESD